MQFKIFDRPSPWHSVSHTAVAGQNCSCQQRRSGKGYLIGPGDEITGKVLGEKEFDFVATVDEDGKIEVPFFDKPVWQNA